MSQRVFVIAPHPDDETIGCGGTILRHRRQGDEVSVVFLTSGEQGMSGLSAEAVRDIRENEARAAAQELDLVRLTFLRLPDQGVAANVGRASRRLQEALWGQEPSLIYVPHSAEAHPDHAVAWAVVRAALGSRTVVPRVLLYEVWSPLPNPTRTENVSELMSAKMRALRCYRSQLQIVRYDQAVRGLNRYRGIMAAGCRYAEAFAEPEQETGNRSPPGVSARV